MDIASEVSSREQNGGAPQILGSKKHQEDINSKQRGTDPPMK